MHSTGPSLSFLNSLSPFLPLHSTHKRLLVLFLGPKVDYPTIPTASNPCQSPLSPTFRPCFQAQSHHLPPAPLPFQSFFFPSPASLSLHVFLILSLPAWLTWFFLLLGYLRSSSWRKLDCSLPLQGYIYLIYLILNTVTSVGTLIQRLRPRTDKPYLSTNMTEAPGCAIQPQHIVILQTLVSVTKGQRRGKGPLQTCSAFEGKFTGVMLRRNHWAYRLDSD